MLSYFLYLSCEKKEFDVKEYIKDESVIIMKVSLLDIFNLILL